MEFIEFHHEFYVQLLLWVFELVVLLNFYQEKKSDTPTILIIDEALLSICMIN
jgi:hypothetical protein